MPMHLGDAPQGVCTSCRRTLIRKTSLLHKINPTALRSSFADIAFTEACATANAWRLRASHDSRHMERLDQSSLHDVRQHARRGRSQRHANSFFLCERVNYHPGLRAVWWSQTGSNRRPPACKAGALPTELWPHTSRSIGQSTAASQY
jgi:hypothetical protein